LKPAQEESVLDFLLAQPYAKHVDADLAAVLRWPDLAHFIREFEDHGADELRSLFRSAEDRTLRLIIKCLKLNLRSHPCFRARE
jgi:hypothetical protein